MLKKNLLLTLIIYLSILFFAISMLLQNLATIPISPELKVKLYKSLQIKSKNRISKKDLLSTIERARQQSWVQQQISNDLKPYQAGITKEDVNHWFNLEQDYVNRLVKFSINGGNVTTSTIVEKFTNDQAFITIKSVVELLSRNNLITDCEFIISMNDYFVPTGKLENSSAIFTFAKDSQISIEKDTILIPDWINLKNWDHMQPRINFAKKVYPWDEKYPIIHWRGGCADSMQQRKKLVTLTNILPFIDAIMITKQKDFVEPEYSLKNKYQIALDGARSTWERIIWQLHSNSVLLKPVSTQIQWFHAGLEPYQNYVPISDITNQDLRDTYTWLQTHDNEVQKIITNANQFANDNLNTIDMIAYYAIVLQEYAKLYKTD